jgi:hypothetical protein
VRTKDLKLTVLESNLAESRISSKPTSCKGRSSLGKLISGGTTTNDNTLTRKNINADNLEQNKYREMDTNLEEILIKIKDRKPKHQSSQSLTSQSLNYLLTGSLRINRAINRRGFSGYHSRKTSLGNLHT